MTTAEHNPSSVSVRMSVGQLIVGSSLSWTVTSKLQVAVFPASSVMEWVLMVVPGGKADPDERPYYSKRVKS